MAGSINDRQLSRWSAAGWVKTDPARKKLFSQFPPFYVGPDLTDDQPSSVVVKWAHGPNNLCRNLDLCFIRPYKSVGHDFIEWRRKGPAPPACIEVLGKTPQPF